MYIYIYRDICTYISVIVRRPSLITHVGWRPERDHCKGSAAPHRTAPRRAAPPRTGWCPEMRRGSLGDDNRFLSATRPMCSCFQIMNIHKLKKAKEIYLSLSLYIYTRILGPPKAGHANQRNTLISMNVYFLKIRTFEQNGFWKYIWMFLVRFVLWTVILDFLSHLVYISLYMSIFKSIILEESEKLIFWNFGNMICVLFCSK